MTNEMRRQIEGTALHTVQVAHVTFTITEKNGIFHLYSQSEQRGLWEVHGNDQFAVPYFLSYEEASSMLAYEQEQLLQTLERKRKGMPTPNQLHFLFREHIPIPLGLTWGQAADLIEERLAQMAYEKEMKRQQRFHGLEVGDRVACHYYAIGGRKCVERGTITKLTQAGRSKYVYIDLDKGTALRTCDLESLEKLADQDGSDVHGERSNQ